MRLFTYHRLYQSIGGVLMSYTRGVGYGGGLMGNFFAFAIVIYVLLVIILRMGYGGYGGVY